MPSRIHTPARTTIGVEVDQQTMASRTGAIEREPRLLATASDHEDGTTRYALGHQVGSSHFPRDEVAQPGEPDSPRRFHEALHSNPRNGSRSPFPSTLLLGLQKCPTVGMNRFPLTSRS